MAWLEYAAWPSLTRKRWALGYKLVHLSGKQSGDILINSLGHTRTLLDIFGTQRKDYT